MAVDMQPWWRQPFSQVALPILAAFVLTYWAHNRRIDRRDEPALPEANSRRRAPQVFPAPGAITSNSTAVSSPPSAVPITAR
jgi:hypothetical protein